MTEKKRVDDATNTEFVGHEWDGIEELNTPLPRWWLLTLYVTIVWGVIYTILFPAWPLVNGATKGLWNWSSRGELAAELNAEAKRRAPVTAALAALPVAQIEADPKLRAAAIEGGRAAFKVHCVQCHGSGAAGSKGYPNLNDDDWLWGGSLSAVHYTITHGVRQPDSTMARTSQMPAFDGVLSGPEVDAVVAQVRVLSGQQPASALSAKGAAVFATNCIACHGADGKGLREFGAPNLTDGIWLYGGDPASIRQTVLKSRFGVMPRWDTRLDPVTIKMLASYVHSLGGGEAETKPHVVAAIKADNVKP